MRSLKEDGDLEKNAKELDLYYVSGCYPDAFPVGAPFELITKEQAERMLEALLSRGLPLFLICLILVCVDILVYTPEEFEALRKNQRGFWKSFNDTHVKIL